MLLNLVSTPSLLKPVYRLHLMHEVKQKNFCFGRNLAEQTAGIGI